MQRRIHKHLPNFFIFLDKYNKQIFENNNINTGIIYRNYHDLDRENELIKITSECKKKNFQLFVSNNVKLAIKVKANGLYIPAFNSTSQFQNLENKKLIIIGSAHNQNQIKIKILQKCKAIFLSPIFYVEKSNKFLGLHKFNYLVNTNKVKFLALGGINELNINKLKLTNINGIGGIRLFKKKPAYKRPVF